MTCVDDKHSKILAEKNVRRKCAHARSCNFYTFWAKLEAGWRQAGGRLEAGWRQAGGRSRKDLHLLGQTGGRLEGVHVRIYTFLAKLDAGWRQ